MIERSVQRLATETEQATELAAAGLEPFPGAQEQALGRAQYARVVGAQFEPFAARLAFPVGSGVDEVALVELGRAVFATEAGTQFAGAVVEDEFVPALPFVFLGFVPGERLVGRQAPGGTIGD